MLMQQPWRVESDAGSSGTVTADGQAVTMTYKLRDGERASQFVALVVDLPAVPADVNAIVLRGRAAAPLRVSAQLRFANDGDVRWRKSVYLDAGPEREAAIPFAALRPAAAPSPLPPVARATSLLFVVDLTNAVPGAQGSVTLRDVALARQE
jgi:hypothetical protein